MSSTMVGAVARRCTTLAVALAAGLAVTTGLTVTAASAQTDPTELPDLRITAALGDPDRQYLVGEDIPVTVTIANAGAADATVVRASSTTWSGSHVFFPSFQWGDLSPFGPGATIAAGATRVVELTGSTFSGAEGNPLVRFTVYGAEGDADYGDNTFELAVQLVPPTVRGTVGGVVFGDRDADGAFDDGEGLAGVMVHLSGGPDSFEATTDAGGRFAVPDVPARIYSAYFSGVPDGWIVPYLPVIRVDGSDASADLRIIGVRPLSDTLHATIEFTQDSYQRGELAHLRVTLSNSGTTALSGIVAGCNRAGEGPHVGDPADWGPLAYGGDGAVIGAGETRAFDVTTTVPQSAIDHGYVYVACDFGDDEAYGEGFPQAHDTARVPGLTGDNWGTVYRDRNGNGWFDDGEGIAKVKVGLADPDTGEVVARAVTDASGRVDFTGVPNGIYLLRVYRPWLPVGEETVYVTTQCVYCGWVFEVRR